MKVYEMIDIDTNKVIHKGYATTFIVDGTPVSDQVVRQYADTPNLYIGKYKFKFVENDGKSIHTRHSAGALKKAEKYTSTKPDISLEEFDNEAKKRGMTYGQYQSYLYIESLKKRA